MGKANKTSRRSATRRQAGWVVWIQHGAPAAIFLLYVLLWQKSPEAIPRLAQEDSWIEWLTVAAFGSASAAFALVGLKRGWRDGWFAWGLALFCFLVAGEEMSWGQRLLGFVPPQVFLEKNYQEEANLHNIFNEQMGPKWMLVFIMAGWGLLLPALRHGGAGRLLERLRVIEPPIVLAPWFIFNIALLQYYPLEMTAEYNELIAGLLFLVTALPLLEFSRRTLLAVIAPTAAVAVGASYLVLQDTFGSPQKLACAEAETRALTAAIEAGETLPALFRKKSSDHRVHSSIEMGFLKPEIVHALDAVVCEGVANDPNRRLYALDPWGQPYWLYYERGSDRLTGTALVYSFGPNRRYDSLKGAIDGTDDVGTRSRPLRLDTHLPL